MSWFSNLEEKIKEQLQTKLYDEEVLYGKYSLEEVRKRVERYMFGEEHMTVEWAERCLFPFEQSGYLTTMQKLELLIYLDRKKKRKGETATLLPKLYEGNEKITEKEIEKLYLKSRKDDEGFLSGEEKREFLVCRMVNQVTDGLIGILLSLGGDEVLLGECCPYQDMEEQGRSECRIGIRKGGRIYRFTFLKFASEEELERTIRNQIMKEKKGEITRQSPVWHRESADGTCLYAIRPPAAMHWGMKISLRKAE